jgi:ribosome-interacting GTPase 1
MGEKSVSQSWKYALMHMDKMKHTGRKVGADSMVDWHVKDK